MAKYSFDFKRKIVLEYLQGKNGYGSLAKKYHISSKTRILEWVAAYRAKGDDGLKRSCENKNYSFQFKLNAVQLYLNTETSYRKLALSLGMKAPSVLVQWVSRYRAVGTDGLKSFRRGRPPKVAKKIKHKKITDSQLQELEQLREKNLKLRIENDYLKELRRLCREEEAQKRQQGLSTVSEDSTD